MHAKYVSTIASTQAQIINDLALLISGSPISALSASCDKANTTLISTVLPGWTLLDAAAGSSGCVLTAPDADGLTTKYVRLFGITANWIDLNLYESWNSATHVGTNVSISASSQRAVAQSVLWNAGVTNTYWIFATPRMLFITGPQVAGANVDGSSSGMGAFEFTRECEYLKGSTYPCVATGTSHALSGKWGATLSDVQLFMSRTKNLNAAGDYTAGNGVVLAGTVASYIPYGSDVSMMRGSPTKAQLDGQNIPYYELRPIHLLFSVGRLSYELPILGRVYDVFLITRSAGKTFDTVRIGEDTYMIMLQIYVNSEPNGSAIALKVA